MIRVFRIASVSFRRSGFFSVLFLGIFGFWLQRITPQCPMFTTQPNIHVAQTIPVQPILNLRLNRPLSCLLKLKEVNSYQKSIYKHNKIMRQLNYMKASMQNGCIPKGIKDQSTFRVSFPNEYVQNTCQSLYYFAASRTSDVIRTHLNKTVQFLRQCIITQDKQLDMKLSRKELETVVDFIGKQVEKSNAEQNVIHARKLRRDLDTSKCYVPWEYFVKSRIRKKRRFIMK